MYKILLSITLLIVNLYAFALEQGIEGTRAKLFNGAVTEGIVNEYMKSNGYRQVYAEVGRNGIDGLFYKMENGKKKFLTIESKYNNAKLGTTVADGDQMTQQWKKKKVDEKIAEYEKLKSKKNLTSFEKRKVYKEIKLLKEARKSISKGSDRALLFRSKPLSEEYKELKNKKMLSVNEKGRLNHLENLKKRGRLESTYKNTLYDLDKNGKVLGESKFKINNQEIDLKRQYKVGTGQYKQQKLLKHSIRKEKRLLKEKNKLKSLNEELKKMDKKSTNYLKQEKRISKQTKLVDHINQSKLKYFKSTKGIRSTGISRIGSKIGLKTAGVASMSALSAIPILGVAAQVAMDAYMMHQIENQGKAIEQNKENIKVNTQYIKRLEKEQEILGIQINENTRSIETIVQQLYQNEDRFKNIENQFITISNQISNITSLVDENTNEIQNMKDAKFTTAIDELNDYLKSNDSKYLNSAVSTLREFKKVANNDILPIVNYNLAIFSYDQYLISDNNDTVSLKRIKSNFEELIAYTRENPEYLNLALTTYLSISDLNGSIVQPFRNSLNDLLVTIIDKKLSNNKYDEALKIASKHKIIYSNSDLYESVYDEKLENYNHNKNFTSINDALNKYKENQNSLLNKEVVTYLYDEDSFINLLNLLPKIKLDDEDFRIKVYLLSYKYSGNIKKLNQLTSLILENPTYSKMLKDLARKYQKI